MKCRFDTKTVSVDGHDVITYSVGDSDNVILFLNGGPGMRSNYIQETHAYLAKGYRVVTFDQLCTGRSSRPDDPALWTIERYCNEVKAVVEALCLKDFHLYGHSWGGMLAIEYALNCSSDFRTLVLAHTFADCSYHQTQVDRLVSAFGEEVPQMRKFHIARGTTDHPEFQASQTLLGCRHTCRMSQWPDEIIETMEDWSHQPFEVIVGSEYEVTGNLKTWNRVADLHKIKQPTLVLCGEYDALTPVESLIIQQELPDSRIHMFRNVAHLPFYECPSEYRDVLEQFWLTIPLNTI
jgi:proline iminopeptidase